MPSGAGLVFTLLSLLFAWLLWQGRGEGGAPRWQLRLRSLIPPLLLAALIPSGCASERFDALRLYAEGMRVTERSVQGGRAAAMRVPGCEAYFGVGEAPLMVVGRNRGCVDLVVADPNGGDVEGAAVRLDHPPGAAPLLRLATLAGGGGAVVTARDADGARSYVGAVPIADGDSVCLRDCAGAGRWWTFDDAGTLAAGGDVRTLTLRPGPYGWLRPYGPADRIHRLGQILCDMPAADGRCASPATTDPAARGQAPPAALSFLFQDGGMGGGSWRALLLDPGARLRRADGTVVQPALAKQLPLAEGESVHLALLAIRGNSLRELRSFTIGHELAGDPAPARRFTLSLDTPEMVPIGRCAQPLSRLAVGGDQLSPEAFALASFGNRPDSVLASAAAALPIDRFDLCRSTRFAFASPLDPATGDASGGPVLRQLSFSVDRMGIPWLLLLIAAATAFIVHALSEGLWQRRPLDGILLALVQYLLAVRAAIGIEGAFNDPALAWQALYADAGTAMVALPAVLIAARRRDEVDRTALLTVAILLAAALAALWWWLGPPDAIGQVMAALAAAALALRAVMLGAAPPASAAGVRGRLAAIRNLSHRPPGFWPALLAIIVGARILLGLLGYRERVFGVALSAVYVPLLLIVVAAILAEAEAEPARRRRLGLFFLGALAVGAGLVAIVINDVGFALVHLPPIAGIALWRLRLWRREQGSDDRLGRFLWAAPAAGLAALYFALWAFIALSPPPAEDAPLESRVAYAVSERATDPNWLRLRAVFAPDQIAEIGNRAAAVQLDQSLLLGELTGTLLGRGWLGPVDLGSFRYQATHLSDYLGASHLMAPFGRLGAFALLLVLAAAAGAAMSGRALPPAAWPPLAGALALWIMFGAAAYMVCANLLLVPFTGRNIYLLAASSGGDLIEGLGLLLMARIGLAHRRAA